MSSHLRIGFFDSGVGGFSVLRHLRKSLPSAECLYVADSANAPYGARDPNWIRHRSLRIAQFLEDQGVDALVIACNTATAHAAEAVRAQIRLPVVAMEPAIKPAISASRSGRIAVLATEGTLRSTRFERLKNELQTDQQYFERACHHWVEAVENNLAAAEKLELVRQELQPLLEQGVDTFVLACTHFPFLEPQIRDVLSPESTLIDPSQAVVRQLLRCLPDNPQIDRTAPCRALTSHAPASLAVTLSHLIDFPVDADHLPDLQ